MKQFKNVQSIIKHVRTGAGLTQEKFGRIFRIRNIDICKYEKGINDIPGKQLMRIINFGLKRGYFDER